MKPTYMLSFQSCTGAHYTEYYDDLYKAYKRYEELLMYGVILRCDIYVKMFSYTRNKAE